MKNVEMTREKYGPRGKDGMKEGKKGKGFVRCLLFRKRTRVGQINERDREILSTFILSSAFFCCGLLYFRFRPWSIRTHAIYLPFHIRAVSSRHNRL
jgi:hypothetical protein